MSDERQPRDHNSYRRTVTIATHDGSFHTDETLAVAILQHALPLAIKQVVRTRNAGAIDKADIVVDVGGVFDPLRCRFDHHMSERPKREDGSLLSAAGLIWRHYGERAVTSILGKSADRETVSELVHAVEVDIIRPVDLVDNGVSDFPAAISLFAVVDRMNIAWDFVVNGDRKEEEDRRFKEASHLMERILINYVHNAHSKMKAREHVRTAYALASDKRVVELPGYPLMPESPRRKSEG